MTVVQSNRAEAICLGQSYIISVILKLNTVSSLFFPFFLLWHHWHHQPTNHNSASGDRTSAGGALGIDGSPGDRAPPYPTLKHSHGGRTRTPFGYVALVYSIGVAAKAVRGVVQPEHRTQNTELKVRFETAVPVFSFRTPGGTIGRS